jgi:hypothetical protein
MTIVVLPASELVPKMAREFIVLILLSGRVQT